MDKSSLTASHARDLVSRITHDDPEVADLLFQLCVVLDSSTPVGAATRSEILNQCFCLTGKFHKACEAYTEEILMTIAA